MQKVDYTKKVMLTIKEAAVVLALHEDTVRRKVKAGEIPSFRMRGGKLYHIPIHKLQEYIERNTTEVSSSIPNE
tara:strand:+ start:427 stop:648 length:222 start_codon:yes stop_codon:yes gene_type:complete